jgi:GT2 family glycosyltransferase
MHLYDVTQGGADEVKEAQVFLTCSLVRLLGLAPRMQMQLRRAMGAFDRSDARAGPAQQLLNQKPGHEPTSVPELERIAARVAQHMTRGLDAPAAPAPLLLDRVTARLLDYSTAVGGMRRAGAATLAVQIFCDRSAFDDLELCLQSHPAATRIRAKITGASPALIPASWSRLGHKAPVLRTLAGQSSAPDTSQSRHRALPSIPKSVAISAAAPSMTIVIVARGRPFQLYRLLTSLANPGGAASTEIVVILNGSQAAEAHALRALFPHLKGLLITAEETEIPIGQARNKAIATAHGDLVLSLDADMVVLEPIASILDDYLRATLRSTSFFMNVGYINADDLGVIKHGKSFRILSSTTPAGVAALSIANISALRLSPDDRAQSVSVPSPRLSGGASILPRQAYTDIGGFSADVDIGWEDLELSLRLWTAGRMVICTTHLPLLHGHLVPMTIDDFKTEQHRFDPSRLKLSRDLLSQRGFAINTSETPRDAGAVVPDRLNATKAVALSRWRADAVFGAGSERFSSNHRAIGLVTTMLELTSDGRIADLLEKSPPSWRFVGVGASEIYSLTRIGATLAGVDCIVLTQKSARYLRSRLDPWHDSFKALNQEVRAHCYLLEQPAMPSGDLSSAVRDLATLLPHATITPITLADSNTSLILKIMKATVRAP